MIELSAQMRDRLAGALADGCPVVAGSVDGDGQPHLSFFGTAQVHSSDQLALWVRDPGAPFLRRIAVNPKVALLYRNGADRVSYQFHGRAHPVDDEQVRRQVFDRSPEVERSMDPERGGVAVVVDVDHVRGRQRGESLEMSRSS